jgi:hypothetical protein
MYICIYNAYVHLFGTTQLTFTFAPPQKQEV